MNRSLVAFRAGEPAGSVIVRYCVSPTDALVGNLGADDDLTLQVSFRDAGPGERVRVFLMKNSLRSTHNQAVMAFDSDTLVTRS